MIISHKHKFIFIKTRKTAGTSLEIALSKFCGEDDIITSISAPDEVTRKDVGGRGPQNFLLPYKYYGVYDYYQLLRRKKQLKFYNHCPASFIVKYINPDIWNTYYKFCFERNPWDKTVSFYYHDETKRQSKNLGTNLTLSEFIQNGMADRARAYDQYTLNDKIVVDKIYEYSKMSEALLDLRERFGFPEELVMPNAKGGFRKDKRHYRDVLTEHDAAYISKLYAPEISYFNYEF